MLNDLHSDDLSTLHGDDLSSTLHGDDLSTLHGDDLPSLHGDDLGSLLAQVVGGLVLRLLVADVDRWSLSQGGGGGSGGGGIGRTVGPAAAIPAPSLVLVPLTLQGSLDLEDEREPSVHITVRNALSTILGAHQRLCVCVCVCVCVC